MSDFISVDTVVISLELFVRALATLTEHQQHVIISTEPICIGRNTATGLLNNITCMSDRLTWREHTLRRRVQLNYRANLNQNRNFDINSNLPHRKQFTCLACCQ